MEKRFVLAVVLCLFILMFYQSYMGRQQDQSKAAREAARPEREALHSPAAPEPEPTGTPGGPGTPAVPPEEFVQEAPVVSPVGMPCEEVVVNTPLYRAVFCSNSGRLMSWKLKKFRINQACTCPVVNWFTRKSAPKELESGPESWVERIHAQGPEEYPLGLEISTGERRISVQEILEPDRSSLDLQEGDAPSRIVFSGADVTGRAVRRVYTFSPDRYLVDLQIEIEGIDAPLVQGGMGLNLTERYSADAAGDRYTFAGFMGLIDGKLVKKKKVDDDKSFKGDVVWEGFSDKYFLTCLIPENNPVSSVILDVEGSVSQGVHGLWTSRLVYNIQSHTEGEVSRFAYRFFIGPKEMDVLKESGHSLRDSIDLGWFGFIAEPLLFVLKFFYKYTHNYGIAIILLTVIIKVLFYPLTRKQYESMKDLQKLQPKMKDLREKFKNDKERLNKEVMDLYRTHKINPLGGCWPVLLQIPVFFALYRALLNSIELRHAPFMFWIRDLAEKDPCYITPLIMGATMFLQQKMTPTAGDPAQQKMMMLMPVVFTFLFLNFPSGLVVYWLVNNVITIGQQYISQKRKS
jgi:YidC/Oxa1 family membrane protein insertase